MEQLNITWKKPKWLTLRLFLVLLLVAWMVGLTARWLDNNWYITATDNAKTMASSNGQPINRQGCAACKK